MFVIEQLLLDYVIILCEISGNITIVIKLAFFAFRLEAYDGNFNFGNRSPQASQSQSIDMPDIQIYQDVNLYLYHIAEDYQATYSRLF